MTRREFTAATLAAGIALHARADDPKKLRVGVIGHTGRGDYGHGVHTMWLGVAGTEITAVADPDAAGLAGALKKLNVTAGFADYRKMLSETKPDLVAIGMRHVDQHRDVALAAVESGAKGIYIEKPFCRTPAEADEIVEACDKRKVKLAIAHRNRWHPALPVIGKLVKDGVIGKLLEIRTRGKEDPRGGSLDLWVLGSHVLNLANYFAGDPLACTATVLQEGHLAARGDVKDGAEGVGPLAGNEVHARFEMESGVPVFFDSIAKAGTASANFGVQLIGNKGVIDLRVDTEPLGNLLEGNPFTPAKEPRAWVQISSAGIGKPEPDPEMPKQLAAHITAGLDLVAAIREDRQPLCSAHDGRVIIEMICAVFESHRQNGARVKFPLENRSNPFSKL